ncbi:phage portal protein [Lacticaseibacillus saniviri]
MALEVDIPGLDPDFLDRAGITYNDEFTYPADVEITAADLLNLVDYHSSHLRPKYAKERDYYRGKHDILKEPGKPKYKPDNRVIFNFPRKAVTTFNGYFIGNPVKIDHKDEAVDEFIAEWTGINDFEDVSSEVAKEASMYGHAYFFVYQSKDGKAKVAPMSPLNAFLIYDDTEAHEVRYGVVYRRNYQNELEVTLYDDTYRRDLVMRASSGNYFDQDRVIANPYKIVPIIEVAENTERMGLFEDIVTLIDQLDKAVSQKANDIDYFADAMLLIKNASIDSDKIADMKDNRMLNIKGQAAGDSDARYLDRPDADTSQENLINRLSKGIYEISNVTNLNDESFSGNPSGVSLRLKYQAMQNMARDKSLKFRSALRKVFQCVFAVSYDDVEPDAWRDLQFKFTQDVPTNLLEDGQAVNYLYGKISNKTLFKQLPFIEDPDAEIEQMKQEQREMQDATADVVKKALSQAQTDQQKAGVADDNGETRTQKD